MSRVRGNTETFRAALSWLWRRGRIRIVLAACAGLAVLFSGITSPHILAFVSMLVIGGAVAPADPAQLPIAQRLAPSWADHFNASQLTLLLAALPTLAVWGAGFKFAHPGEAMRALSAMLTFAILSWLSFKATDLGGIAWLPIGASAVLLFGVDSPWGGAEASGSGLARIGPLVLAVFVLAAVYLLARAQASYAFSVKPEGSRSPLFFDTKLHLFAFVLLGLSAAGIEGPLFVGSLLTILYLSVNSLVWLKTGSNLAGFRSEGRVRNTQILGYLVLFLLCLPLAILQVLDLSVGVGSRYLTSAPNSWDFLLQSGHSFVFLVIWVLTERDRAKIRQENQRQRTLMRRLPFTAAALLRNYLVALAPPLRRGAAWLAVVSVLVSIGSWSEVATVVILHRGLIMALALTVGVAVGSLIDALDGTYFSQLFIGVAISLFYLFIAALVPSEVSVLVAAGLITICLSAIHFRFDPGGAWKRVFLVPVQRWLLAPRRRTAGAVSGASSRGGTLSAVPVLVVASGLIALLVAQTPAHAQVLLSGDASQSLKVEKVMDETGDEPVENPQLRRPWREVVTPHFTLYGDASDRQMKTVARSLESLRAFLDQMSREKVAAPVPTFVYVFRNHKSYRPYGLLDFTGEFRESVGGFFTSLPHANYLVIDASRPSILGHIAKHEYTHFFASYRLPPIPLWFNEGLAEFYGSFETTRDHVNIGKILPNRLHWLRNGQWMPLSDLFAVNRFSPEYNQAPKADGFYAQSWALVHYLFMEAEGGRSQLARFLELRSRLPVAEAFEQAFAMSMEEMEGKLRKYVRSSRFSFRRMELPAASKNIELTFRPLADSEALARLGELLAPRGYFRFEAADAHLRVALEQDPEEVRGHVGLGLRQLYGGPFADVDAMVRHFAEAKRLAPEDPSIGYLHALSLALQSPEPASLRRKAAALVETNVRFLGAWKLLAWTWSAERERIDDAIGVFVWAHRLMPEQRSYADHLHGLYLLADRHDDAARLEASFYGPRGWAPIPDPGPPPLR